MTNNEKLIDEARKLQPTWHRGMYGSREDMYANVKPLVSRLADALEAAEKAHTPSDDEREALVELLLDAGVHTDADDDHVFCSGVADRVLAYFRPSEKPEPRLLTGVELDALFAEPQPEPSSEAQEPSAERELTPCGNLVCTGCRVCGCPALGIEPQGEPSSQAPEPSAQPTCEHGTPLSELCDYAARYASGETDGPHPEHAQPQGEPSDAQVLAAVDAFMASQLESEDGHSLVHKNMAAALRAAGVLHAHS